MADTISVEIWDATGSKRQSVQVPSDAPVNRFIAVLVERLNLPRHSPDGQPMSYKLHHRGTGRQLLDTSTLAAAGVQSGDIMRLQPEITAGANSATCSPMSIDVEKQEGRFSRFELIGWWEQTRLREAKIVVIGAGALGNELIKNFALLGIGRLFVADLDLVEESNLSRSVLFRLSDRGKPKVEAAARAARDLFPDMLVQPWRGNVVYDLGLGVFRWADVIVCGLDNREARVAVNGYAARVGRVWVDGAIERLDGVARVFDPATGPCYECTMNDADWRQLEARRSCALLTRDEMAAGKVPTTPTTASVVAGIQSQEVVKYLHGLETMTGQGFVFEGRSHQSYLVSYTRNPECPSHDPFPTIVELNRSATTTTAEELLALARRDLGPSATLELGRDLISGLDCPICNTAESVFLSLGKVTESMGRCPACSSMRTPRLYSTIRGDEPFLDRTLAQLGIPAFDIIEARAEQRSCAYEFSADRTAALGQLATEVVG